MNSSVVKIRSYWLALASLPVTVLGAVGPWVTRPGVRVDGRQDEVVLLLATIAGCALLVQAASDRRWLAAGPFLIGLTTAALVANDIRDPADVASGAASPSASLQWGIYLALAGSTLLAVASGVHLAEQPLSRRQRHSATESSAKASAIWPLLASITPFVAAEHRKALFLVPTHDKKAGLFLQNRRPRQFVRLARAVKILRDAGRLAEGGVLLDIGAHIGTTSIMALREHGFSKAVAIEPDPDNVLMLRASAVLNGVDDRIQVITAALSDSPSKRFFVPGRGRGGWTQGRLTTNSRTADAIETVNLDELAADGSIEPETVSLIWCGHPVGGALLGCVPFFERRIPLVLATGRRDEKGRAFLEQIARYYSTAIDLRENLDKPLSHWTPRLVPVDDLAELTFERHTDVLVL